jgi:hypothetical protein
VPQSTCAPYSRELLLHVCAQQSSQARMADRQVRSLNPFGRIHPEAKVECRASDDLVATPSGHTFKSFVNIDVLHSLPNRTSENPLWLIKRWDWIVSVEPNL